jgi:hypothetical protein
LLLTLHHCRLQSLGHLTDQPDAHNQIPLDDDDDDDDDDDSSCSRRAAEKEALGTGEGVMGVV